MGWWEEKGRDGFSLSGSTNARVLGKGSGGDGVVGKEGKGGGGRGVVGREGTGWDGSSWAGSTHARVLG